MGVGVALRLAPFHGDAGGGQRLRERARVADHLALIVVLAGIHLIQRRQKADQRTEVMVAGGTGTGAVPHVRPQRASRRRAEHHAALRAEEGLVRAAGDDRRALGERRLEGAVEAEHVRHVEHQQRRLVPSGGQVGHRANRLRVQEHALAEHDQVRAPFADQRQQPLRVRQIGIVGPHRDRIGALGAGGVAVDRVEQRPHRLGAQVAAFDQAVVDHRRQSPQGTVVAAILQAQQRFEDDDVGELAADRPRLYPVAAEEAPRLRMHLFLDLPDEVGALVEVDLRPLQAAVLGVAPGGVGHLARLHQQTGRGLRRDQIDALALAPSVIDGHPVGERGHRVGECLHQRYIRSG